QSGMPWERARVRALAVGAGPVGLLGALSSAVSEYETHVYSLEPSTDLRADIVRGFGANYICGRDVPLRELGERLGPLDVLFEAVGLSVVGFEALEALGPNGVLVFTSVPPAGPPREIDTDRFVRDLVLKNQRVLGTVNSGRIGYEHAVHKLE